MSLSTSLLDRVRLRVRSRRALEADRDGALACAARWRREVDAASQQRDAAVDLIDDMLTFYWGPGVRDAHRARYPDWAAARAAIVAGSAGDALARRVCELDDELKAVRAELRATGHRVDDPRGLSYDVDIAIDTERERGQDLVERLAHVLGWRPHRSSWPHAAPHLVREVAVRLGKPMPRWRPHRNAWPPGSRIARALACTCRGERLHGPTSIVDPRCPEHSPGYRFGGWPTRPLALAPVSLWVIDPADGWRPVGRLDGVPF